MKNFKNLLLLIAVLPLVLLSCNKDIDNTTKNESKSVKELIANQIMNASDINPDFSFLISSVNAIGLLNDSIIQKPQVITQAYSLNKEYIGDLFLNTIQIPFNESMYFIDFNHSENNDIELLGSNAKIEIIGGELFQNLQLDEYCPKAINYRIENLVDNNRYNKENGFKIVWEKDMENLDNPIIIGISGEDQSNEITSKILLFEESDGEANIENSVLSEFDNFNSIQIYVARGTDKYININDKIFEYTVINFAWSRIYKL